MADCKNYSYENKNLIKENTTGYNKWEIGLGNELIPIQQIDTTTNSKMLEEMCLGDTQNEEKYCRRDPNKVSQNPNAFKIDKFDEPTYLTFRVNFFPGNFGPIDDIMAKIIEPKE